MPYPPHLLTHAGKTLTLKEWLDLTGLPVETIRSRIDEQGYTVAEALTAPAEVKFDPRKKCDRPPPRPCPQMKPHPSGQAYCRFRGGDKDRFRYFGPWGSDEAASAYKLFAVEWASAGAPTSPVKQGETVIVALLVRRYMVHVREYYVKDGKPASEVSWSPRYPGVAS